MICLLLHTRLHFRFLKRLQVSLTRVFEYFLSKIIFSSTAEITEGLISKLIDLFGIWSDEQNHEITSDINLFKGNKLHPSPGLLCIIFGYLLKLGFVFYLLQWNFSYPNMVEPMEFG